MDITKQKDAVRNRLLRAHQQMEALVDERRTVAAELEAINRRLAAAAVTGALSVGEVEQLTAERDQLAKRLEELPAELAQAEEAFAKAAADRLVDADRNRLLALSDELRTAAEQQEQSLATIEQQLHKLEAAVVAYAAARARLLKAADDLGQARSEFMKSWPAVSLVGEDPTTARPGPLNGASASEHCLVRWQLS